MTETGLQVVAAIKQKEFVEWEKTHPFFEEFMKRVCL